MYLYFTLVICLLGYYIQTDTDLSLDTKAILHIILLISIAILYYLDEIVSKLDKKQPNNKSKQSNDESIYGSD